MKNKVVLVIAGIILSVTLVAMGCAAPAPAPAPAPKPSPTPTPPAPPITLSFSTAYAEPSPSYQVTMKPILEEVEKKSNGRIKFQTFLAGALGSGTDQYDIARTGKADIANLAGLNYVPGRWPMADILTVPGAFESSKAGAEAILAITDKVLVKEHPDVELLTLWQSQVFWIYTSKVQIKTADDIKGLKLRSPGGFSTKAATAMGAVPVTLAISDVYTSMDTGVVDGAMIGPSGILSFKLQEVSKNVLKYPVGYSTQVMVMNKDSWAKVPADLKPMVKEAFRKAGEYEVSMFIGDDPKLDKMLSDKGGTVNKLTPAEEAKWGTIVGATVKEWAADLKSKGKPVDELMSTIREECKKRNIAFPY